MPDYREHLADCVACGRFSASEADRIRDYITERAATVGISPAWEHNHYHLIQRAVCLLHEATGSTLETCSTGDILATVAAIRARDGSPNYARQQVAALKTFAIWLAERRPEVSAAKIASIKLPAVRWKNRRPEEMLTCEEVLQVIDACRRSRDRALIAMLYDGSNRPSELLALNWSDIHPDEYGAWFETSGKTGKPRRIRLTVSLPHLAAWKADSPDVSPSAPVFCNVNLPRGRMTKDSLDRLIAILRKRTGIAHLTPYVFRPSRITHDVSAGLPQAYISLKNWGTMSTPMMNVYTNLGSDYTDQVALEAAGIRARETPVATNPLKPVECPRCKTLNPPGARGCCTCFMPLTEEARAGVAAAKNSLMENLPHLLEVVELYKRGELDLD